MLNEEQLIAKENELKDVVSTINKQLKNVCRNEEIPLIKIADIFLYEKEMYVRVLFAYEDEMVGKNLIYLDETLFSPDNYYYDEETGKYDEKYVEDFDKVNEFGKGLIKKTNIAKMIKIESRILRELLKEMSPDE